MESKKVLNETIPVGELFEGEVFSLKQNGRIYYIKSYVFNEKGENYMIAECQDILYAFPLTKLVYKK